MFPNLLWYREQLPGCSSLSGLLIAFTQGHSAQCQRLVNWRNWAFEIVLFCTWQNLASSIEMTASRIWGPGPCVMDSPHRLSQLRGRERERDSERAHTDISSEACTIRHHLALQQQHFVRGLALPFAPPSFQPWCVAPHKRPHKRRGRQRGCLPQRM